jgi:hypothetical protein
MRTGHHSAGRLLSSSSGLNSIQHGDRIISRFQISNALEIKSKGWNQAFHLLHANRHERADCLINGDRQTRNSNSAAVRTLLYRCTRVARICDRSMRGLGPQVREEGGMSLVRLLGFTTLACGCVIGRYREVATSREVSYVEEKGKSCGSHGHRRNHTLAAERLAAASIALATKAS